MTLQELADKEDALYREVIDLDRQPQSGEADKTLQDIFLEYKEVHKAYAELSLSNNEALKRGLFIQWYALAEPNYLTGIAHLDENAENIIIQVLNDLIDSGKADRELIWMLNYYAAWDWIFDRLPSFKGFNSNIVNEQNNYLPDKIDKEEMLQRGQMGRYWNSLTKFSNV
jgi:hypothetical protein